MIFNVLIIFALLFSFSSFSMEKENNSELNAPNYSYGDSYEQSIKKEKKPFNEIQSLFTPPSTPPKSKKAKLSFNFETPASNSVIMEPVKPIKLNLEQCEGLIHGKYKEGTPFKRYYVKGLKKDKKSGIIDFLFSDKEILEVYHNIPFDGEEDLTGVFWSKEINYKNKFITLYNQGALQSCSYTCVYCAIKNHKPDFEEQKYRDLIIRNSILNATERCNILKEHKIGYELVLRKGAVSKESLDGIIDDYKQSSIDVSEVIESRNIVEYLRKHQTDYSFALFTIDDKKIGSHCVIFLSVEEDGVIMFDPLHGWVIKVSIEAFELRANKKYIQDLIWIKNQ